MKLIPQQDYHIKESKRAKHVTLRIKPGKGLLIVTPSGYSAKKIPAILKSKEQWIARHAAQIEAAKHEADALPDYIRLPAITQEWEIHYSDADAERKTRIISDAQQYRLHITSSLQDTNRIYEHLCSWLRKQAKAELLPWLDDISQIIDLPYNKGSIRNQKTRWGSCAANGNIQLNQKLLFLPEELVHYILVHELCHTIHMNHSKAFWQLVSQFEPDYKKHEYEVRHHAWRKYIPYWA